MQQPATSRCSQPYCWLRGARSETDPATAWFCSRELPGKRWRSTARTSPRKITSTASPWISSARCSSAPASRQADPRFPWDRIHKLELGAPAAGVRHRRLAEREDKFSGSVRSALGRLVAGQGDSPITLGSLDEEKKYRIGTYKGDAIAEFLGKERFRGRPATRPGKRAESWSRDRSTSGDPSRALPGQAGRRDRPEDGAALQQRPAVPGTQPRLPTKWYRSSRAPTWTASREGFVEDILNSYLHFVRANRGRAGNGPCRPRRQCQSKADEPGISSCRGCR